MADATVGVWLGFGRAVKEARVAQGLSQAELGAPAFSRSYVSLLELGVRAPTEQIITHLADRLGLPVQHLREWALAAGSDGTAQMAIRQTEVLTRLSTTDLGVALKAASDLRNFALETDRLDLWWTATVMDLSMRIDNDHADEVIDEARRLARHWFTTQSPYLSGRVRSLLATALRITGQPEEAISEATSAVEGFKGLPDWPVNAVASLTVLVSTLGQQRRYAEAQDLIALLTAAAADAPSPLDAGNAWWALGNLCLRTGRYDEGLTYYDKATAAISPDSHLRRWGRLQRAAADFRLQAEIDLGAVPRLLRCAQMAFDLSAADSDRAELDLTRARHAALIGDHAQARDLLQQALDTGLLMTDERAGAHQQLGAAFAELGDHHGAATHFHQALTLIDPNPPLPRMHTTLVADDRGADSAD